MITSFTVFGAEKKVLLVALAFFSQRVELIFSRIAAGIRNFGLKMSGVKGEDAKCQKQNE